MELWFTMENYGIMEKTIWYFTENYGTSIYYGKNYCTIILLRLF